MDSDESQDASSGNESEYEQHQPHGTQSVVSNQLKTRSSSRETIPSRSSNNSYDIQSPQSPVSNASDDPPSPKSVENVNNGRPASSANSTRSNSPVNLDNDGRSPETGYRRRNYQANNVNPDEDSRSDKSRSSHKSKLSGDSSDNSSVASRRSSKSGRKAANLDDGNTSDSSVASSEDSDASSKQKPKLVDVQPEEISDGDIESSDHEKDEREPIQANKIKEQPGNLNIGHEDLSDVSDLEDSIDQSDYGTSKQSYENYEDHEQPENKAKKAIERSSRSEDAEEQLDFEAEDGECAETEPQKDRGDDGHEQEAGELRETQEKITEELEEGELTDEEDVRPEEVEPRPVCRFFSRGQCTWGASCRFLHPGVTDKGNYTMFDLVRPVVPGDYANDRLVYGGGAGGVGGGGGAGRMEPPPMESAWERGLRTAKEMMRKSIKRKEQDIDFEEKKMNLSLAQEEFDKENGYYAKAPSPEPRYVSMRHPAPIDYPAMRIPSEEYYGRRQVVYEPDYVVPSVPRERVRSYREIQAHRQPDYYNKHEEEPPMVAVVASATTAATKVGARRPKREVIVQRVEERSGRGDEWSDPWMRSKSPVGRKGTRRRSYSSGSSYSSSSTSRSSSVSSRSTYRSRSRSSHQKRSPRTHRRQVSPSVIVSERKAANERAALMNPPAPRKKAPSPGMMRVGAQNPPAPSKVDQFGRTRSKLAVAAALARVKGRAQSSRSSSGSSSGSSSSDSDSSGSSSSSSRNGTPSPRRPSGVDLAMALKAKAIDALKSGSEKRQIKLNLKNSMGQKKPDFSEIVRKAEVTQGRKRAATSPPTVDPKSLINKKASSRREELLKQLKAVEDAIAKKRSKVN